MLLTPKLTVTLTNKFHNGEQVIKRNYNPKPYYYCLDCNHNQS